MVTKNIAPNISSKTGHGDRWYCRRAAAFLPLRVGSAERAKVAGRPERYAQQAPRTQLQSLSPAAILKMPSWSFPRWKPYERKNRPSGSGPELTGSRPKVITSSCAQGQAAKGHFVNLVRWWFLPGGSFRFCQCWLIVCVIFASHVRSLTRASKSTVAKNLMPLAGGLPKGLSSLAATSAGTSCDWQLSTQAACSAVRRAGNWPSSWRN